MYIANQMASDYIYCDLRVICPVWKHLKCPIPLSIITIINHIIKSEILVLVAPLKTKTSVGVFKTLLPYYKDNYNLFLLKLVLL